MINYIIINGVNSNTKNGLMINELPPISKPQMRTNIEEIDGRDGDIITKLGYSAYDKTITIGLWGTSYDVNDIIAFFNKEGTITFSNDPDKYYKFTMLEQIDIERLLKFKTASITFHCQPFKYPLTETPKVIEYEYITAEDVETASLNNTTQAPLHISLKGNTSQDGTPTPDSPQPIHSVSGDNTIVIESQNIFNPNEVLIKTVYSFTDSNLFTSTDNTSITIGQDNYLTGTASNYLVIVSKHLFSKGRTIYNKGAYGSRRMMVYNKSGTAILVSDGTNQYTPTEDFEGYLGIGVNANQDMGNKYMFFTYDSNGTFEAFKGSQTYPINLNFNEYDKNKLISGKYIDGLTGELANSTASNVIDYTSIEEEINYILDYSYTTLASSGTRVIAYYGEDKSFISAITYTPTSTPITTTTPENAKYIRITLDKNVSKVVFRKEANTPIELCKIGDYQDYFYKDSGKWYLRKAVGKKVFTGASSESWGNGSTGSYSRFLIDLANSNISNNRSICMSNYYKYMDEGHSEGGCFVYGGKIYLYPTKSIDTDEEWLEWLSTHNTELYYPLATPTNTEITDNTLIGQLDAIKSAISYEGQTNVGQENNDKPFLLDLSAIKEGTNEVVVNNIGNTYSKPTIALEGTGDINIYLNGTQMLKATLTDKMTIDTTNLEAYNPDTMTLLNRQLVGDISKFKLDSGNNTIKVDGNLTTATITDYTRWL